MTPISPKVRMMTIEEVRQAGFHSRGLVLEHQGNPYKLNAGFSDQIHVFTKSIGLYVLTINKALGYIGLDAYMPAEPDPINTIFLHSEYQFTETLGLKWKMLSPSTITQRLINYLI